MAAVVAAGCRHTEPLYRLEPTKACLEERGLGVVQSREPEQPLPMLAVSHPETGELIQLLAFHRDHGSAAQAVESGSSVPPTPKAAVGNVQLIGVWTNRDEIRSCLRG